MPTIVKDLGPILGLVSFAAFITLLVLFILRTLELRKLRRDAPFLFETNGQPEEQPRPSPEHPPRG